MCVAIIFSIVACQLCGTMPAFGQAVTGSPGDVRSPGVGEPYQLPVGIDFQSNQYRTIDDVTGGFNVYQHYEYGSVPAMTYQYGPVAAPGGAGAMGVQALNAGPGACMWECTAYYTPVECMRQCQ
ncbi:MAG: hypothetical protein A4E28_00621 [Methanocella sp. PtaU1.Bin125]|nr:MAG: hypothetical protein A4E28_00621 [Methanocella sp. PtaU1.Bin125]